MSKFSKFMKANKKVKANEMHPVTKSLCDEQGNPLDWEFKHINEWGVLQYFDTLSKGENGQAKADALLQLYNKKTRNLKIVNALGDTRVRAGSMVVINLALGDMNLKNFMLVEKVKHTFKLDQHFMDLTLRGGEFVA